MNKYTLEYDETYENDEGIPGMRHGAPVVLDWLRNIFRQIFSVFMVVVPRPRMFLCLFLLWYIYALHLHLEPLVWWTSTSISLLLLGVLWHWRDSIFILLPPLLLLFNTLYHWDILPWPSVKISILTAGCICVTGAFFTDKDTKPIRVLSFPVILFFLALSISGVLAILRHSGAAGESAVYNIVNALRNAPIIVKNNPYISIRYVWIWALAIGMFAVVARRIKSLRNVYTLLWSSVVTTIPMSLFGIYSFSSRKYLVNQYIFERRINSTCSSPAVLADIMTCMIIISFYLLLRVKTIWHRLFLVIAIGLQLIAILLSGCRINIVILGVCAAVYFITWLIRRRTSWRAYVLYGGVIIVLLSGSIGMLEFWNDMPVGIRRIVHRVPLVERVTGTYTRIRKEGSIAKVLLRGRHEHWLCAYRICQDRPWWGIGVGMFEQKYTAYRSKKDLFQYANVHNVPLRIIAEGGIISFVCGVVCIGVMIFYIGYGFTRRARRKEPEWSGILRLSAVLMAVLISASLTSDILYENTEILLWFAFAASLGVAGFSRLRFYFLQHFRHFQYNLALINEEIDVRMAILGWAYFGRLRLETIIKMLLLLVLFSLGVWGGIHAYEESKIRLYEKNILYGFTQWNRRDNMRGEWFNIHHSGTMIVEGEGRLLQLQVRAPHWRIADKSTKMTIVIDGYKVLTLPINSVFPKEIYADVSAISHDQFPVTIRVDSAHIPLHEGWYESTKPLGVLVTRPQLRTGDATNIYMQSDAVWSYRLSKDYKFYTTNQRTNAWP